MGDDDDDWGYSGRVNLSIFRQPRHAPFRGDRASPGQRALRQKQRIKHEDSLAQRRKAPGRKRGVVGPGRLRRTTSGQSR